MAIISEQEFRVRSDDALHQARQAILRLADAEGFEVELQNGVLELVFEEPKPAKFVISPNAPVRQIWVSAMARSYKLAWDAGRESFVLGEDSLTTLLDRLTRQFLGIS